MIYNRFNSLLFLPVTFIFVVLLIIMLELVAMVKHVDDFSRDGVIHG